MGMQGSCWRGEGAVRWLCGARTGREAGALPVSNLLCFMNTSTAWSEVVSMSILGNSHSGRGPADLLTH